MPCASIAAMRTLVSVISKPGASSGCLITAIAAGTAQWAWMSMVLTLLPLTATSRRRAWACPCGCDVATGAAALCIAQPVKAIPCAGLLGTRSPLKDMAISPLCFVGQGVSLQRLDRGVAPGGALVIAVASATMAPLFREPA